MSGICAVDMALPVWGERAVSLRLLITRHPEQCPPRRQLNVARMLWPKTDLDRGPMSAIGQDHRAAVDLAVVQSLVREGRLVEGERLGVHGDGAGPRQVED